jgi:hypothetical protein
MCVLLDSPLEIRRVVVRPFQDRFPKVEKIELFMAPGDAYVMDGEMQKSYSHAVPAQSSSAPRIVIVFRTGDVKIF